MLRVRRVEWPTGGSLQGVVDSDSRWWDCPLDVETLAAEAVGTVRRAAAELARVRGLDLHVSTTPALIAASFAAHEHLRVDGRPVEGWAELSGFLPAADGWVRLHGNYPHHAEALRRTYGIQDRAGLERVLTARPAAEIEREVTAAGGIAARVRNRAEWEAGLQHAARRSWGWVEVLERGERPIPATGPSGDVGGADGSGGLLDGVRVLDLTRVIAGPTASQLLACLGADVLRVDPPHRPEIIAQHLSTGMGKRSAILDLRDAGQRERARTLAAGADVILTGYRPGMLARHGLGIEDLTELAPHAVIGALSAWGESGPWGERAGFDSIVQAATGIAELCGSAERPGALPVQALDHATGHRLAGAVLEALAAGCARTIRISLLGAADALLALPRPHGGGVAELPVPRVRVRSGGSRLFAVPPPLLVDGRTIERDVPEYGAAAPVWRE